MTEAMNTGSGRTVPNPSSFPVRTLLYKDIRLELGSRTLIMGILNATPDSFSDGGRFNSVEHALDHARQMLDEGADLIDIGGESTRPGSAPVSLEEELQRVLPIVKALAKEFPGVPLSIDTYKGEVAREALQAGAHIINDVWGFKKDPQMASVAAAAGCPVILMHNRTDRSYTDFLRNIREDLQGSIDIAREAGVKNEHIMLDPGIGFAKSYEENLYLMNHLHVLTDMGYPVLLGTSRKTMIRSTLGLPADDVVEGTIATTVLGIMQGCQLVRVHDVRQNKRAAAMTDPIVRSALLPPG